MVDLAAVDNAALIVLQWVTWTTVGVAVAFGVGVVAIGICCGIDCLRDWRAARSHAGT